MEKLLKQDLVHQKEKIYLGLILFFSISTYLYLLLSLIGIVIIGIIMLISYSVHAVNMANIRRNAVRVSEKQFPDVYEKAKVLAAEMGIVNLPAIYVMESDGVLNAFASRFFGKDMVVLYSELFDLIEDGKEEEMMYILAHEFAHVKRRHVLLHLLILPAMWVPFVGNAYMRACEYTCDRHAAYYVNNMEAAQNALTTLAIGKKLQYRVNKEAFIAQLEQERGFFAWLSEKMSTHPDLPKRLNQLLNWQSPEIHGLIRERKRNYVYVFLFAAAATAVFVLGTIGAVKLISWVGEEMVEEASLMEPANGTPLMEAAGNGDIEAIQEELAAGADISAVDESQSNALHWAVWAGQTEAAALLIEEGIQLNQADEVGDTPFTAAAYIEDKAMVQLLLDAGANPEHVNDEGYTALEYAEEFENQEIANLLK